MKKLKYICVQPRLLYYAWQVEVMINNFINNGINPNDINIIVSWNPNDTTSSIENIEPWDKLVNCYKSINFYFYEDTRNSPVNYISSVRPNALKQHFALFPELSNDAIFYHDCDILFTKPVDFTRFINDDIWYVSDTNSYINYDYIISKGYDVYDKMCEVIGINPMIPKLMNSNSGGAQYIMKNLDSEFWNKVETDCENLFLQITQLNRSKKLLDSEYHELQIWCADMWAVLWNAWMDGYETKIVNELNFCWSTDPIVNWHTTNILHNAGVTHNGIMFHKSVFTNMIPYYISSEAYSNNFCSIKYVEEILKTKEVSCLI